MQMDPVTSIKSTDCILCDSVTVIQYLVLALEFFRKSYDNASPLFKASTPPLIYAGVVMDFIIFFVLPADAKARVHRFPRARRD